MSKLTIRIGGGGIGFVGALTIALLILKLTGIHLSWFWVLSPIIFVVGLYSIVLLFFLFLIICMMFSKLTWEK